MSKYKCVKCRKTFKNETVLKTHTCNKKQYEKIVQCNLCPKSFTCQSKLKNHMRSHSNEKTFKCSKCNKCFKTSESLGIHENRHNGIEYKCDQCEKSFPAVKLLKRHKRLTLCGLNGVEKPFKCLKCNESFKSPTGLKNHEEKHNDVKYKCALCEKSFLSVRGLKQHNQIVRCNSDERPFKCLKCNKCFKTSEGLEIHENRHNGIEYKCDQCEKSFPAVKQLKRHKRITIRHKNKYCRKPKLISYKCYECLELFENESLLNVHVKNHSVFKKQFPCFNCGISFDHKRLLKSHGTYVHTNERPFECDECKVTFKRKGNLNKHKYTIHMGIRMHHCFQCNESFTFAATLRDHLQSRKHKRKVKEIQIQGGEVKDEFVNADQVTSSKYQMQSEKSDDNNISLTSDVQLNDNSYNEHLIKEEASSIDAVKSFHTDTELMEQSLTNTDEKIFECDECKKRFELKEKLNLHKKRVHVEINTHHCFQCNKSFKHQSNLKQHFKSLQHKSKVIELQGEGENACVNIEQLPLTNNLSHSLLKPSDNSNIFLTSDVHLNGHSSNQHPIKEEACSIEGAKSSDADTELMRQSFTTKDGKRFECDECLKKFQSRSSLIRHKESVHLRIRPYHCFYCNTSFTCKDKLERHFKTLIHKTKVIELQGEGGDSFVNIEQSSSSNNLSHSVETPLEKSENSAHYCFQCKASFSSKKTLTKHFKSPKHKRNELQKVEGGPVNDEYVNSELSPYSLSEQSSNNFNRYIPNTEDNSDNDTILLTSEIEIKDELINQNDSDNSTVLLTSEIEIKDESIQHFAEGEQNFIMENLSGSITQ